MQSRYRPRLLTGPHWKAPWCAEGLFGHTWFSSWGENKQNKPQHLSHYAAPFRSSLCDCFGSELRKRAAKVQSQLLYLRKKNKPILRLKWQRVVNYQTGGENKADAVDDLRQHQIWLIWGRFSLRVLPPALLLGDGSLGVFYASVLLCFDLARKFISCVSRGQLSVPGNTAEETSVSTCHVLPRTALT